MGNSELELITYAALPTALCVYPVAVAIALMVSELLTVIADEYTALEVVGVDPSVV